MTLLGPSGCGKTTTLRLIAGFVSPDEGEIYLGDQLLNPVPPWQRGLGFVFQNYALFPHMHVFDNLAFGLEMRRASDDEVHQRVTDALRLVGLSGMESRYPSQLSGGQQQRVALARALVIRPRVLLLDEPLSNLDAKLRAEMRTELKRIQQETGITTVYVTHDQEEALSLSDKIVVMNVGRPEQIGPPEDIWSRPANLFVADFVGVENLIPAEVVEADEAGGITVRSVEGEGCMHIQEPLYAIDTLGGASVTLGIRAFNVSLSAPPSSAKDRGWLGRVLFATYKGEFTTYRVETPLSSQPLVATSRERFSVGEEVAVYVNPAHVLLLPEYRRQ